MKTIEIQNGETKATMPDIDSIPGHEGLRRAIEVALVGGHPLAIVCLDNSAATELVRGVLGAVKVHGIPFHALVMPPCPCGNYGSVKRECRCSAKTIERHLTKVMKRRNEFDIFVESVGPLARDIGIKPEPFAAVIHRILAARQRPEPKADIGNSDLFRMYCREFGADAVMAAKVKTVAQSVARLAGDDSVAEHHIVEAIQYSFRSCGALRNFDVPETLEFKS